MFWEESFHWKGAEALEGLPREGCSAHPGGAPGMPGLGTGHSLDLVLWEGFPALVIL